MPEPELHEVTDQEWKLATEYVIGCRGDRYYVPDLKRLGHVMAYLSEYYYMAQANPRYFWMLESLAVDLNRLCARRIYYSLLPESPSQAS